MRKSKAKPDAIVPGGVDAYVEYCPGEVQGALREIRAAIREAAPGSTETVSYFQMPGYSYEGYDYNGMFAWFSFKAPHVRLHVRPPVLEEHAAEIEGYKATKAIVSFPAGGRIPVALVRKLVKASVAVMKQKPVRA